MSHDEKRPDGGSTGWVQRNLLALGSAAVLAVYSAGYVRTKEAAERFANEGRRPAPAKPPEAKVVTSPAAVTPAVVKARPPKARSSPKLASKGPPKDTAPAAAMVAQASPSAAQVAAPPPPPTTIPAPAPAASVLAPIDTTVADTAAPVRPVWKDGEYTGWGYSRHGDIEATVVIKNGRIEAALITGCYTQYSCARIEHLQPQVTTRQSPDVDTVSGATQSADAFYFAVKTALGKAAKAAKEGA